MQKVWGVLSVAFLLAAAGSGQAALLNTSFDYNVTAYNDGITRNTTALVTRRDDFGAERRPLILSMPGWGGVGDSAAIRDAYSNLYANNGYVVMNIGFHQAGGYFSSDVAESALAALNAICAQAFVDCSAVVLTGGSYGATQTHPVLRFLRANGVFDGSGGGNAGRRVVGILAQHSGYTLHYANPVNADATAYSVAMIENQADQFFPIDSCDYGNCGARNRGDYHQGAAGSQYVLSYCPPGGSHGSNADPQWDAWAVSAVKTMMHNHRGVAKFTGYTEPSIAPTNACVTNAPAGGLTLAQVANPGTGSTGRDLVFTLTVTNNGGPTADNVVLTDTLPGGALFVWTSHSGCGSAAGTVSCNLGSMPAGTSAMLQIVIRPSGAGMATNNASVTANGMGVTPSSLAVTVNASPAAAAVFRYRLYSDVTKEHHFTADLNEYNVLGGNGNWNAEGTVGKILDNPGSFSGVAAVPYYRLYDTSTRWHHWTTDANEYYTLIQYPSWNAEGVDGFILPSAAAGSIQLYRLNYPFLGSLHHWTIDTNEYNVLTTSYGWIGEGGAGFVIP